MTKVTIDQISPMILGLLQENIDVQINITGVSMLPLLVPNRDKVLLTKFDGSVNKNDIVLFRRLNGDFVLHRVYAERNNVVDCVGDSQRVIEKNIPKEKIVAKAIAIERNGKHINIDGFGYKCYVFFWSKLRVIRSRLTRILYKKYYEK